MPKSAIEKACDAFGSQRQFALAMGVSPQAITKWLEKGVPAERVLEIERVSGVSRHELRPDLYPLEAA